MNEVHKLPPSAIEELQHRLDVLNRRAVKLGFAPIEIEIGAEYESVTHRTISDGFRSRTIPVYHTYVDVKIVTDHTPRVEGYALVARLDFEDGVVIINNNPTFAGELPVEFRTTSDSRCDHCNTNRQRNSVVVLEKGGEFIQIGRNCAKDFIGNDPSAIFNFATIHSQLEDVIREFSNGTGGGVEQYSPLDIIAVSLAIVAESGYTSVAKAREFDITSTASMIHQKFSRPETLQLRRELSDWWTANVTEDVMNEASTVIEWVQAQEPTSDYIHNLITLTAMESIMPHRVGLVGSAVVAYQKAQGALAERTARPDSHYVGELGKRGEFEVKFVNLVRTEGFYGTTFVHMFNDTEGNDLTWFGSRPLDLEPSGSEVIKIKATVKKHESYKGREQTIINRVTLI